MLPIPSPPPDKSGLPPAAAFMQNLGVDTETALDILSTAIQEVQEQENEVRRFAALGDVTRLGKVFHSLKGAASTMGDEPLADYFSRREQQCEQPCDQPCDQATPTPTTSMDVSIDLVVMARYLQALRHLYEEVRSLS